MVRSDILTAVGWIAELVLLGWITWQGELIRRYEKWTYEMNKERYEERARWRAAKQRALLKKADISDLERRPQ